MSQRIGVPEIELPHILSSEREPDYRKFYNGDTVNLVRERYEEDVDLFGYAF